MTLPAPGPRGWPILGSLWALASDPLKFFSQMENEYGAVVQARIGHLRYHLVNDPKLIEEVLWRRAERYTRTSSSNAKLRDLTGSSLLTTDGEAWRMRRKLIAPFLNRERITLERPTMAALASSHWERWNSLAAQDRPVNASSTIMALTCAIVSKVLFGTAVEDPSLEKALENILAHHWRRLRDPFQLAHRLPSLSRRAFEAGNRTVARIVAELSPVPGTLFAELAAHQDIQVTDELITLLIAGHETTASSLIWALQLLAQHPKIQEQLREEALSVSDPVHAELPLAQRIFQEAMRLYPSIWLIERRSLVEDELGGFLIPKDSDLIISPWVMHRSPRFWDAPERFDPDRFLSPPAKNVYLPFGMGPHSCVGAQLALNEGPLLLALIARSWRWSTLPNADFTPQPGLTLRMKHPLQLLLQPV